jgi:hypothetical protein
MKVQDILSFFSTNNKISNGLCNKTREDILLNIDKISSSYYLDKEYGKYWILVSQQFNNILKKIYVEEYTHYTIILKAGRQFNYDFEVNYYKDNELLSTEKVEFKYNCQTICKLPQILQLSTNVTNSKLIDKSYAEFCYDNYLQLYMNKDKGITEKMPDKLTYLKGVHRVDASTPFFQQLKQRENINKKLKNDVVNKSIEDYLLKYGKTINFNYFENEINRTQNNKNYILWYKDIFYYEKIDTKLFDSVQFGGIKNKNTILLNAGNYQFHLLLRWKNGKGILNPAWQISIKNKITPSDSIELTTSTTPEDKYSKMKVNELKEECEKLGIKSYKSKNKSQLLEILRLH